MVRDSSMSRASSKHLIWLPYITKVDHGLSMGKAYFELLPPSIVFFMECTPYLLQSLFIDVVRRVIADI